MQKIKTILKQTDWRRAFIGAVVFGVVFSILGNVFDNVDGVPLLNAVITAVIWMLLMVVFTSVFQREC